MAKPQKFTAGYGASCDIKGVWHKFWAELVVEIEPGDNIDEVKKKTWNTVINEVEKQFREVTG